MTAAAPAPPLPAANSTIPPIPADWQPLPRRARSLATLTTLAGTLIPLLLGLGSGLARVGPSPVSWTAAGILALVVPACTVRIARRRWMRTRWRLDADGFGVRRGHLWFRDIRVPGNRIQHIDLRRGPLERAFGLATLAVHTAGTRNSAVSLAGLEIAQAEQLRDALAARAARDDDHDSA